MLIISTYSMFMLELCREAEPLLVLDAMLDIDLSVKFLLHSCSAAILSTIKQLETSLRALANTNDKGDDDVDAALLRFSDGIVSRFVRFFSTTDPSNVAQLRKAPGWLTFV